MSIERAGAAQTVIINTGISTIAPLRNVLAAWSGGLAPALINCYEGPRFSAATQALPEQAFGGRAHEIETSLMLAIDAARVRLGRAAASNSEIVSGRLNRANPSAAISSPRGVNGDPTLASQIKGEQLLAALLADLIAAVRASASGAEHALYYNRRASFELPHARRTLSGFTRAALPPPAMEAC